MSAPSAIRLLQTAIENVREQCAGDPKCKDLLAACAACDKAAEEASSGYDEQPKTLEAAGKKARKDLADAKAS